MLSALTKTAHSASQALMQGTQKPTHITQPCIRASLAQRFLDTTQQLVTG